MKIIILSIVFAFLKLNLANCQELKINDYKFLDSLKNNLKENEISEIVTLHIWDGSSCTYLLWKNVNSSYIKKINSDNVFKTISRGNKEQSFINISNVFDYINYKKEELFKEMVRPSFSDLIDSTNFEIYKSDTVYGVKVFGCFDCPEFSLTVFLNNNENKYFCQSIHFEKSNKYYLENISSDFYHLYLLIQRIINFYDINQLWKKE